MNHDEAGQITHKDAARDRPEKLIRRFVGIITGVGQGNESDE
jgi:hypothetical protein